MAELPLHIIENILLRLPVKSLIRSRCVCKAWRTLISHPHFVKSHLRLPQTQARTQFCTLNYGEPGDNYYLVVGASTKDCEAFSDDNVDLANKIVLWNPSTRQCNQLPPNPNVLDFLGCHGFGYDSFADDYKVFVVSMLNPNFETVVDVFSLKSNKWKRIQEKHHTRAARMCATVLHGALHWVAYDPILGFDTIMAFDFEKERFREMAIPREEEELYVKLRVVGGCLCVHGSKDPSKMWVMKEYGVDTSWSKMASPLTVLGIT
ncbi:F-box protein CPR1 [Vitis vinifera]|uniref:F-box protein CPR1 n=1 Tax=Vitis vinifera TaxID=29760 RepID=A0A438GBH3_VITVI|nr:F-box protein CPR1 [Vitis vinifera]